MGGYLHGEAEADRREGMQEELGEVELREGSQEARDETIQLLGMEGIMSRLTWTGDHVKQTVNQGRGANCQWRCTRLAAIRVPPADHRAEWE